MNDEQIADGIISRKEQALTELMAQYGKYVFSVAFRILGDTQSAEECVNDALQALWTGIPPKPKNLKYYFTALVRNRAINRRQAESALKRGGSQFPIAYEELSECIPCQQTPEKILMYRELSIAINRFLETLSPRDRDVFLRRYYFFEDTKEIAKRYGIRNSNVLLILSRTRKKLRNYLETEGYLE